MEYGKTTTAPERVQALQADIQRQKAAASQAVGESNIARRFQQFNTGEAGRVAQATTRGALRRAVPGVALGAVVPALTTVAAQTAAEQNIHPDQSVLQSFTKVATNPQTASDMFRASGLTNSANQLDRGGAGSLTDRFVAASKDAQNLITNNLFNPLGHAVEAIKSRFSGDPAPSTPLIPDVVTGANAPPKSVTPAPAAPVAAAPVAAGPTAPATPQAVFAKLQGERGFTPLGGVDPNAQVPPSIYSRTDPVGTAELERRQYATPGGSAEGVVPRGAARGGFGGAATDAEAARNLQARAEQDAAASQIAAGFDRTTERLRDNRAEAMGISRAKLDASEGRSNPLTSLLAPQGQQQATVDPFSLPGDGFGDAELRRSTLERKMGDTRTSKAERQAAAAAYTGFLGPAHGTGSGGPANGHSPDLFNLMDKLQDNRRADLSLDLQGRQFQETQRANRFSQNLQSQQEQRISDKQYNDQGKEANEAILKDRTQYIKDHSDKKTGFTPQMDQIANFGLWVAQKSTSLQQSRPDFVKRILDGTLRYEDWGALDQMHRAFEASKPAWYNPFGSPAGPDEITQRYFDFNAPK